MKLLLVATITALQSGFCCSFVLPRHNKYVPRQSARLAAKVEKPLQPDELSARVQSAREKASKNAEKAKPNFVERFFVKVVERWRGEEEKDEEKKFSDTVLDLIKDPINIVGELTDKILQDPEDTKEVLEYDTYPPHPQYPDRPLDKMPKMVKGRPPFNPYMWSGDKFELLTKRILQFVQAAVGHRFRQLFKGRFRALYKARAGLPEPEFIIDSWKDDSELARQALAGLNPLQIERVSSAERVSSVAKNLADKFQATIDLLMPKGDLYILDYKELVPFASPNVPPSDPVQRFFYPAVALLAPNAVGELQVIGIQLERGADAKVYTPADPEHIWLYAKLCVSNADGCVHEWLSHLGRTHLTVEPHIVAMHNTLRKEKHVLYDFITPFIHDTLILNWAARQTLVAYTPGDALASKSVADTASSIGGANALAMIQTYWEKYDYMTSGFDDDLRKRGFEPDGDPLDGYLYLKDGSNIYKLLGDYATSFVNALYKSDEAVRTDNILQEWAAETSSPSRAYVHGFPASMTSREQLSKVLQILMWTASGLHAAVNFPQFDLYSYVPNHPFELRKPIAAITSEDDIYDSALSPNENVFQVFQITVALTLPSANTLTVKKELPAEYKEVTSEFQKKAKALQEEMNKLNKKRKVNYPYLLPKNVPYSIDI